MLTAGTDGTNRMNRMGGMDRTGGGLWRLVFDVVVTSNDPV